jgi:SAM-dependent methyltransferase
MTEARYERIGTTYAATRQTEPRIAAYIDAALGDARSVVNVGAGAGSYEPADREVVPVEPSETMAAQRPPHLPRALIARAEDLPLPDDSVDAAMAIITVHHWSDLGRGIAEMRRVARLRILVLTLDPDVISKSWVRDYVPELIPFDYEMPNVAELAELMGGAEVIAIPAPNDCVDVYIETVIGRPELLLDPLVRANCSGFARMDQSVLDVRIERLRADLESGEWDRRHGELRAMSEHNGGIRLLVAELAA